MAKKQLYFGDAERLYVIERMTIKEIALSLDISEKTARLWKEEGDWEAKRRQYLLSKESFHEELYEFARKLMRGIKEDMEAGNKVDAGRLYTLTRMLPLITKVKDYEDVRKQKDPREGQSGLDEDVIKLIEKEVLNLE